jgi:RNA polymerase sigma factor (sigma-70 family)
MYLRMFEGEVDVDEIADAVMEKLMTVWPAVEDPLKWVITCARNRALDELAKRSREQSGDEADAAYLWHSSLGVVDYQLRVNSVLEALKKLSPPEYRAVVLSAVGFSNTEVADLMRLSPDSVAHYLYEGRKKLGRILRYSRRKPRKFRRSSRASRQG